MARAAKLKGLRGKDTLAANAQRVVNTRLEELLVWRQALGSAALVNELHDMRIAAKRLRYALEMFDLCFPELEPVLADTTSLQETLGDIHDLDVVIQMLRSRSHARLTTIEDSAVEVVRSDVTSVERTSRLKELVTTEGRDRRNVGTLELLASKVVERANRYVALQETWEGAPLDAFARRVQIQIGIDPVHPGFGNGQSVAQQ